MFPSTLHVQRVSLKFQIGTLHTVGKSHAFSTFDYFWNNRVRFCHVSEGRPQFGHLTECLSSVLRYTTDTRLNSLLQIQRTADKVWSFSFWAWCRDNEHV